MKQGQIIAVYGNLFEYGGIEPCEYSKEHLHKVYEIDIDEDGVPTATLRTCSYTDEDLKNNEVNFTKPQWYGVIELLVRQNYNLADEDIEGVVKQVVESFAGEVPKTIAQVEENISLCVSRKE
ncbi:MAG: hypothetical protein UGF89_06380 [Acutalibacteraceae bacterium]|nr:hypothetical protein [Acutalibacteraceae bacterium]